MAAATIGLAGACQGSQQPSPNSEPEGSTTVSQTPPGQYQIPEAFAHHSFYWTAEPGIDLTIGAAVPVRAFFESWTLVWHQFQPDQAYPGYAKAAEYADGYDGSYIRNAAPDTAVFGTTRYHLVTLSSTDTTIHGVVCENEAATINPVPGGSGYTQLVPGIRVIEFNFGRYPSEDARPVKAEVPQQGPRQAPTGDVFNDFRLIKSALGQSPGDPLYDQYGSQCRAGLANPASVNLPGYDRKEDPQPSDPEFQPLPQTPGWPDSP
ncbi:hypothetical protein [Mycolicibacterium sp.]